MFLTQRRVAAFMAVCCGCTCLLLIGLWARSYRYADRLHGRLWQRQSFLVASKQGAVAIHQFWSHGHDQWWQWDIRSYAADDELSFPVGDIDQYQGAMGFGILRDPFYYVMRPFVDTPQGRFDLMGAASTSLRGTGLVVPYWSLVLVFAASAALLAIKRSYRFGLRSLLLVMTGLIVLLGVASVLAQG